LLKSNLTQGAEKISHRPAQGRYPHSYPLLEDTLAGADRLTVSYDTVAAEELAHEHYQMRLLCEQASQQPDLAGFY
tara:strand:+ start:1261 stop:1488 length:228 start_codon:yes stop_codon:yes gene_type:complete